MNTIPAKVSNSTPFLTVRRHPNDVNRCKKYSKMEGTVSSKIGHSRETGKKTQRKKQLTFTVAYKL